MNSAILQRHADDYEAIEGKRFAHFYCPILLRDEVGVELCDGHVIGKKFANSSRRVVTQRADVDNFFGSCFESYFYDFSRARKLSVVEHLNDPALSRRIPLKFERDGEEVPHYAFRGGSDTSHTLLRIEDDSGKFANVALKTTDQSHALDGCNLQVVRERYFGTEALVTVLKAAHLTMFSILGYRYVLSTGGIMLANILGKCFQELRGLEPPQVRVEAERFFKPHENLARPMYYCDRNAINGTVDDSSIVMCQGTSGHLYAVGVFVRMEDLVSVVFLPSDNPETIGTYDAMVRGQFQSVMCRPGRFVTDGKDRKWEVSEERTVKLEYSDDATSWHSPP